VIEAKHAAGEVMVRERECVETRSGTHRTTLLYLVILLLLSNLNGGLSTAAASLIVLYTLLEALLSGGVIALLKQRITVTSADWKRTLQI
jgi:hypothetical protein